MKRSLGIVVFLGIISTTVLTAQTERIGNTKEFGIAINPVFALFGLVSTEVNLWKYDRTGEINVPVQYLHNAFDMDGDTHSIDIFSVGTYYRKFFNRKQEGFFVQGGYRFGYADIDGRGEFEGVSLTGRQHSILFGLGYRLISQENGLFWAFALAFGRAWGQFEDPTGDEIIGDGFAFDGDLLKIGYAW